MAQIKKAVKEVVKKTAKKEVKKEVVEAVPVTCNVCRGSGLHDQYSLCTHCSGSGAL